MEITISIAHKSKKYIFSERRNKLIFMLAQNSNGIKGTEIYEILHV